MRQLKISNSVTNRSGSLDSYLKDIDRYPLLSVEEEVDLFTKISNGVDVEGLKQKIINSNLRFVVSVAKQYRHCGLPIEDLIEEGNIGLIVAVDKYDVTMGFKFISYAVWWIRQAILKVISEDSKTIKIPSNVINLVSKYNKANDLMLQSQQRYLTVGEFIESEGLDESAYDRLFMALNPVSSLNKTVHEDDETTVEDMIVSDCVNDGDLKIDSLSKDLNRYMSVLSSKERFVLHKFFGLGCEPKSLEEIGIIMRMTRERVRQIKSKALQKLNKKAFKELRLYL